ncbi:MAG TPA: DUF4132 domain-containing protein, partial [Verrucomicrobiae bacterium]|nr:DUF4132 domain-containing protein [Verrucomicrobiae bacterium]
LSELLRGKVPLAIEDLVFMVDLAALYRDSEYWNPLSHDNVARVLEQNFAETRLPSPLREAVDKWCVALKEIPRSGPRRLHLRLTKLLGTTEFQSIVAGEAWSNAAVADLEKMPAAERQNWVALLQHCEEAESSKPTQKWLKRAAELADAISSKNFRARVVTWFDLVALPRPVHQERPSRYSPEPDLLIDGKNAVVLKGLAWCCAGQKNPELARALGSLAEVCFKKVAWLGPRCPKVGNACLYSLSVTSSEDSAAQLSRLDQRVKQPTAKKRIGKSLDKAAALTGVTREDLEESSVPTYGLDANGGLTKSFGRYTAELHITGTTQTALTWRDKNGKVQKNVPAELKSTDAFKKFKRTIQDIEKMLPAQRERIERLLLSQREWTLAKWRERYWDHPLLSHITRRLIWHFKLGQRSGLGAWHDGKIVDVKSRPLDWLAPKTVVRLWHPLGFPIETVTAWRRWLEEHQVVQPFKQAHREIYVITDAELETGVYSNRFAAHILKQHQFAALARQRGWQYALMGSFDFQSTPTLALPQWHLNAEFWVNQVEDREQTSETGIALYLTTDQVRFIGGDGDTRELTEVPAIVFSEVMRDVDLFTGVCSVGNDPAWQDSGADAMDYWHRYSVGELSATARTRRDALATLLPKLKIAPQCDLQERFLRVGGQLRTYKIHLGSANILMEPNNQYLCIVPNPKSGIGSQKVFLPFEGDQTLSIIISKAFLLADDSKITDPGILHQIQRK